MVASARVAGITVRALDYGVRFKRSSLMIEMEQVRKRKRDIVESFRGGSERRLSGLENLEVAMGRGRFIGQRMLEIIPSMPGPSSDSDANERRNSANATRTVTAPKIFLNVGCQPTTLPSFTAIKNSEKVRYLTSTTVMELGEVPKHLVIIGGGPIGIEFGQMMRRFGAKVSIIQHGSRLLPREDEDISEAVMEILRNDGIEVYLNGIVKEVSNVPTGQTVVGVALPKRMGDVAGHELAEGTIKSLLCTHVLLAAGRSPNTSDLGLASAGVEIDRRGFVKVNSNLETSADGIYSLGDVNSGSPQFTHISYDDSRILLHNILEKPNSSPKSTEGRVVPAVTYMDPQLGRVGETVTSAKKRWPNRKLAVAKMPMTYVARALEVNETKGFMKGVVDKETGEILGFVCLGIEGGELMVSSCPRRSLSVALQKTIVTDDSAQSVVQTAMLGGLKYTDLENAVFAHPTLAESLNNLWASLEDIA